MQLLFLCQDTGQDQRKAVPLSQSKRTSTPAARGFIIFSSFLPWELESYFKVEKKYSGPVISKVRHRLQDTLQIPEPTDAHVLHEKQQKVCIIICAHPPGHFIIFEKYLFGCTRS